MSWTVKPRRRLAGVGGLYVIVSVLFLAPGAEAAVTISSGATENMSCGGGVCSPKKPNAVLNASSLESMLAAGNVTVTTTGSGSVQANDIVVSAAVTWGSSNSLALSAKQSIAFNASLSVTGNGGLSLSDASVESLAFYNGASVTFSQLSSSLAINGVSYVLVGSVAEFASAVVSNQNGYFALAANYNAASDGTYSSAPVQGNNATGGMNGIFEGLGHSISNVTIVDGTQSGGCDGLMANAPQETVSNFGMVNISITSTGDQGANYAGGIVCNNNTNGLIWRSYATGSITMGRLDSAGGLEDGGGLVRQSWANVAINGGQGSAFGGLTTGTAIIDQSFAMGSVACTDGFCQLGGLAIGLSQGGTITNSYSVATVTDGGPGGDDSYVGGLLSQTGGNTVEQSYAAGKITTPDSGCVNGTDCVGGLFGIDNGEDNKQAYWDTTTTGAAAAAGNESADPGTKGLVNKKFIAKLPKGFSKTIWAQSPGVNHGLPYLIANPPPG